MNIKEAARKKMHKAGIHELVIGNFIDMLEKLQSGSKGLALESDIEPVKTVPSYDDIQDCIELGIENIDRVVFGKLNGGLGTSMGLSKAKSLLEVKPGLTILEGFFDQLEASQKKYGRKMPLLLMNSFNTEKDTKDTVARHPKIQAITFCQHKFPKLDRETLMPVTIEDEKLTWNPPGHGDLYISLKEKGILDKLLSQGKEYLFISNGDNLGAIVDPSILGYLLKEKIPFLMEVARRTPADRKGGHLAIYRKSNRLMLREKAQCHPDDELSFQDIEKHKYFNTNSLWIHLESLKKMLEKYNDSLPIPFIVNEKNVNPRDKSSQKVYQLETAMGSAIELFEGAKAIQVPKSRFAPIKKCSDLLAIWSDIYELNDLSQMVICDNRKIPPIDIILDDDYYSLYDEFKERFKAVPSLIRCRKLQVIGDVSFGNKLVFEGNVSIENLSDKQYLLENMHLKNSKITINKKGEKNVENNG